MIEADRTNFAGNVVALRSNNAREWLSDWSSEDIAQEKATYEQAVVPSFVREKLPFSDGRKVSLVELEQRIQDIKNDLSAASKMLKTSKERDVIDNFPIIIHLVPVILTVVPVFSAVMLAALLYEVFSLYAEKDIIGTISAGLLTACLAATYIAFRTIVRKLQIEYP